ncbi:hypothetical protein NQ317_008886 [Molorchus minor]|uniref:Methylcrotonoyl-CoA carboxylase subunit alpha, mitochondrial n=1 Tax=Molorchus minor TaxID=1323400 RepID=A0ABQ9JNC7_9CUCU|nr:hypothetical protein NQ317_008886 [Molorchus minor]
MGLYTRILYIGQSIKLIDKRWKSTLRLRRIDRLLIANRGEIACRVMRTAKRLGIRSVAVYSEVDKNSLHVAMADEAYEIGPAAASQSYLRGDKLLDIAQRANCQAIHPGYGFLSENVEFAENCHQNGIIFVGPPSSAIRDMGIKSTSKHIMANAGVPVIQGYHGDDQTNETLRKEARKIGFPIMIKAVRGGGGKGMRIVNSEEEFDQALESARSESQKSFGDAVVLLEKFIKEPRHVEVQVFADQHGNVVYLHERDCSVQRRHQKIIEEAPAPGLSDDLRRELGGAAVRAAKAVGYVGAGTVEFILDKNTHSFHFMEMNTRLQVEHPVLIWWNGKLRWLAGENLPLSQKEIPIRGHSFEARIYAEDPQGGFLPGSGVLSHLSTPPPSEDVRIETGVREGDEVSVHYDPMIAKLVVLGTSRSEALSKLEAKLLEYNIAGVETNVNFLLDLARHPEFSSGNVHTNFIRDYKDSLFKEIQPTETQLIQAALVMILEDQLDEIDEAQLRNDRYSPFVVESTFRVNYLHERDLKFQFREKDFSVKVKFTNKEEFSISCDNGKSWKKVSGKISKVDTKTILNCTINDGKTKIGVYRNEDILVLFDDRGKMQFNLLQSTFSTEDDHGSSTASSDKATAPMPGIIDKLLVKSGDAVKKGDPLFVLIAMKMEYVVKANRDAKIKDVMFNVGHNVAKDSVVVQFEEE